MQIDWQRDSGLLRLVFASHEALSSFHRGVVAEGGLLVQLPLELELYTKTSIALVVEDETRLEIDAEVAQAFPTPGGDWSTAFLAPTIPDLGSPEDEPADETEASGIAPVFRIQKMNPNEKSRLAVRAGRQERQVLLRDPSPTVLQSLLANPRLEAREVLRLVKSTHTNAGLLTRIAGDGRWGKNLEILSAVAKNPKTPPPLAIRLIERLRTSDLRLMSKMSSGLREDVRRAALREYLKRSGR